MPPYQKNVQRGGVYERKGGVDSPGFPRRHIWERSEIVEEIRELMDRMERIEEIVIPKKDASKRILSAAQKKQRNKIKAQLTRYIEANNDEDSLEYKISLIEDYIKMWEIQKMLMNNVEMKGVDVPYYDKNGNLLYKKNDCVPLITAYNKQMISLLKEMNISLDDYGGEGGGDGDDI